MKKNNLGVIGILGVYAGVCAVGYIGCKVAEKAWNFGEKKVYAYKHRNDVPVCPVFAQYGNDKAKIIEAYEDVTDDLITGCNDEEEERIPWLVRELSVVYAERADVKKHEDLHNAITEFIEAWDRVYGTSDECDGDCDNCDCEERAEASEEANNEVSDEVAGDTENDEAPENDQEPQENNN